MVGDFADKFGCYREELPALPPKEVSDFRIKFLVEELAELNQAVNVKPDVVKAADALADLIYVALGFAHNMNLPFDQIFMVVHAANMTKVLAPSAEASKRGYAGDVIKPEGFIPPEGDIQQLLLAKEAGNI